MLDVGALVGTGVVLALGSLVQRVTGMGLALMASPLMVLIMGPTLGVQTLQVVGLGVCLVSAVTLWRDCNVRRGLILLLAALGGLMPGVLVTRAWSAAWLSVLAGGLTLIALAATAWLRRCSIFQGTRGVLLAGALSGFMNVTSGVGGPPIVIYASTTAWAYAEYVATVQFYFVGLNLASLLGRGLPPWDATTWAVIAGSSVAGLVVGQLVAGHLNESWARRAVSVVAVTGSTAALVRGLASL